MLLEHQSSPDRWIRLRVLNYCVQVWERWRQTHKDERPLPLIVPLVLYHGAQPWQHEREFAGLFTDAVPQWRWVPRFEHLLVDLWSTCWPRSPRSTVRCSSMRCGVTYRVAGGDVMNYVEQLIERGRREGRREGRLEGKIRTIEGLLERDISWSSIEAATGIDEAAFRKFKRQLDAADDGANT